MGFLSNAKNQFTINEASVVIKDSIKRQSQFGIDLANPLGVSKAIVNRLWSSSPEVFDGSVNARPGHVSLAAAALAHTLNTVELKENYQTAFALCLAQILNGIQQGQYRCKLNHVDEALIDRASGILNEVSEETDAEAPESYPQ